MNKDLTPGSIVYVITRFNGGQAKKIDRCKLIDIVNNAVIVVNDWYDDFEETLMYNIHLQQQGIVTDLSIYPIKDCYMKQTDAEVSFEEELNKVNGFIPGSTIYIIEQGLYTEKSNICECMFIDSVCDIVIASKYIDEYNNLNNTLLQHITETSDDFETHLLIYYVDQCYETREQAEAALKRRRKYETDG